MDISSLRWLNLGHNRSFPFYSEINALWDSVSGKNQEDQRNIKGPYPACINQHPSHQGLAPFLSVSASPNKFLSLVVISCCPFRDTERNPLMCIRDLPVGKFLRAHIQSTPHESSSSTQKCHLDPCLSLPVEQTYTSRSKQISEEPSFYLRLRPVPRLTPLKCAHCILLKGGCKLLSSC